MEDEAPEIPVYDHYDTMQDDVNELVYRVLVKLSEDEREFIDLRYQMELSNPQIADIMGISPKAVSERYRRLLGKCRRILDSMPVLS